MHFTTERYERMVDRGVLTEDDRVELIDGEILEMAPSSTPHSYLITSLVEIFARALGDGAVLHVQLPVALPPDSEPEPDLTLLVPPRTRYRGRNPGAGDILLIVEAGKTSLHRDRTQKLPLYARSLIPEVWIVDLPNGSVEVYRDPSGDRYASSYSLGRGDSIAPRAFSHVAIAIDDFLP